MDTLFSGFGESLRNFCICFVPAILGIILHEVGHGLAALREGDSTAKDMGRLTLNPLPHIDPVGLIVFILTSLSGGIVFGWAKPVPFDPRNLRNLRRGILHVALAGPCTNFLLALLWAGLLKLAILFPPADWYVSTTYSFVLSMMQAGIIINLGLGFFNLVPVPPLDGSKVIVSFLPPKAAYTFLSLEKYSFLILIVLIATGLLGQIVRPLIHGGYNLILLLFNIS